MATFKIDELRNSVDTSADVSQTFTPKTVAERIKRVGHTHGRSAEETKALIKSVLAEINRPMTRTEICAAIERKNTPNIRNILSDMARAGELVEVVDLETLRMVPRYWYALP